MSFDCRECKKYADGVCTVWKKPPPEEYANKCKYYEQGEKQAVRNCQGCKYHFSDGPGAEWCMVAEQHWRNIIDVEYCRAEEEERQPVKFNSQDRPQLICVRCGSLTYPKVEAGTGPHAGKFVCPYCNAFLRWIPKTDWKKYADQNAVDIRLQ